MLIKIALCLIVVAIIVFAVELIFSPFCSEEEWKKTWKEAMHEE